MLHRKPSMASAVMCLLEVVNRIRLWRHLTSDATFDVDYWLTRMESPRA